ncbi:sulfotransferase family 2 domain-containing protein [Phaeovulum sp. W22_SRMD_FR3]|uniref:sulfotransferase family 2 domain-containing protein n=1 Tax=Phaeovulum sp. W22_SRMD_FR3 TaxID=3240274 RepID=UPI003F9716F8
MISHEHRCIFVHIPKCADTSIETLLGHHIGREKGPNRQDHRTIRMIEKPLPWGAALQGGENRRELLRRLRHPYRAGANPANCVMPTPGQYAEYFKFAFVRNLWSRAYSWYRNVVRDAGHLKRHGIEATMPFSDFMQQFAGARMLRPQTYRLKDFSGRFPCDFVGRFENLARDFAIVASELNLSPDLALPHEIKGSNADNYVAAFDATTRDLVARIYAEEIKMFGYSFDA